MRHGVIFPRGAPAAGLSLWRAGNQIAADTRLHGNRSTRLGDDSQIGGPMESPSYVDRPFAFILRYVRLRPISHAVILAAVLAAVGCSVTTQYGVKYLVDALSAGSAAAHG